MTLSPTVSRDVRGVEGKPAPPAFVCAHPACLERAQERHHCWRRSQLAGAYDWVETADGQTVRNVFDFCREHHRQLTDNEAWLKLEADSFVWYDRDAEREWVLVGWLTPDVDESLYCRECGQPKRRHRQQEKREARRSKSLTIKVPDDDEKGAEVFDTLVEALCEELGYEGSKGLARYHACLAAMHFTLVNRQQFLAEREA